MTEQQLFEIESLAKERQRADPDAVVGLVAEVRRLQGLIKAVEWEGYDGVECCPWCHEDAPYPGHDEKGHHKPDCPAFSAPGVLR